MRTLTEKQKKSLFKGVEGAANYQAAVEIARGRRVGDSIIKSLFAMNKLGLLRGPEGIENRKALIDTEKAYRNIYTASNALMLLSEAGLLTGLAGLENRNVLVQTTRAGENPEEVAEAIVEKEQVKRRAEIHVITQGSRDPKSILSKLPIELLGKISDQGFFSSNEYLLTDKIVEINEKKKNNSVD